MTSDGHRLRQSWSDALNDALAAFRTHLTSGQSAQWKRVPIPARESSNGKGSARALPRHDPKDISIYRRSMKSGDVYRVVLEMPVGEDVTDLEAWRAVFVTPELRQEWDPAVESSTTLEMFDPSTRIVKTKFTLGWPANPRDAVMISRTLSDPTTVIDISTSLPRSPDEPTYLRPSPPYVRSHVDLFAWCVQILHPPASPTLGPEESQSRRNSGSGRLRLTCFWQHDLKTVWNIGGPNNLPQQLSAMIIGIQETVKSRHARITVLSGYGLGISIEQTSFDIGREALAVDYAIVPEDLDAPQPTSALHGIDELHARKEQRRLQRSVEIVLPSSEGWDIRISTRASSEAVAQLPWSATASRTSQDSSGKICFQVKHSSLLDDHSVLKVKLVAEYSGVLKGIRLNGLPHTVEDIVIRDLKSFSMSDKLLQDASSAANISITTDTSQATVESEASSTSLPRKPPLIRTDSGISVVPRGPAFDKSILSRVRRNYIYFSSLLQEPEAKWKRNTEFRGVSVTQLDSIDPTLVVYKAEATFVGIGLWDLYSAVVTPGARAYWDKQYDDATLLEDVNELSELWHYKTKPAWPVTGRDAVVLKTVYKSPTTVHVFSFSVDETHMFPNIPTADINTIRMQIDLQGWAIEALSPTTTQLTLLEQSDPKGWSGKSTIPQQMIAHVAGIGEFAIKCGGPPIVTRLGSAKGVSSRYEHERGMFRIEYAPSNSHTSPPTDKPFSGNRDRKNSINSTNEIIVPHHSENTTSASVECELRCDIDTWATSLDIVIDPPPQSISCLRRHRLSAGGGGLWLTFGHDIPSNSDERLLAIVRRAPFTAGKEKGVVMVNGKRISVDIEDLPEAEVKMLSKQKRVKPARIPLDQPPVLGVIRRRRAEWGAEGDSGSETAESRTGSTKKPFATQATSTTSAPRFPSPLSNFFTSALEQARSTTQQAVAAFSPPAAPLGEISFSPNKLPLHFALDALSFSQGYHRGVFRDNWILVTDKGLAIHRRLSAEISPSIPVHKGEKVIEGVTAEEVASVIFSYDCRKQWDDRFGSITVFEEFGADTHTAFLVTKGGFPFRDRGFFLSSLIAREDKQALTEGSSGAQSPSGIPSAIYCISASFNPDSAASFSPAKYNPSTLPVGRVFIDAWIIETLDPYTAENYAIPSTKCTRLVAFDYAGSIPVAVNSMINSALPRSILAVELYLKGVSPFPEMKLPAPGFRVKGDIIDSARSTWRLRRGNEERILLDSKLSSDSKVFVANVLVSFSEWTVAFPASPSEDLHSTTPQATPRPSKTGLPSRPSSPKIRRERVDSEPSSSPSRRRRGISYSSVAISLPTSNVMRSRSRDRLKPSSSAFSIGRDIKGQTPSDFIVAELIVDLRTYTEGYEVWLSSQMTQKGSPGRPNSMSKFWGAPLDSVLPISHAVYILPPSPLYASGSGAEPPVRHLLRFTLPTSQYEIPAVDDPLTGETRSPPQKPDWYKDLEGKEKCALVRVEVKHLASEKRKKGKKSILVDGVEALAVSEREANKGYIAVEDASIGVLSRVPVSEGSDALTLPPQLSTPITIDDSLLDQSAKSTDQTNLDEVTEQDVASNADGNGEDRDISDSPAPSTPIDEKAPLPPLPEANSGFLAYLSSYQNSLPLLNFRSKSSQNLTVGAVKPNAPPGSYPSPAPTPPSERISSAKFSPAVTLSSTPVTAVSTLAVIKSTTVPRYSLSTLLAAALIAFLLGSLLRSLLSPADFIYVVTDLGDVPEGVTRAPGGGLGAVEPGWREIKRLVELKYVLGGWDFQIAAVRRH